MQIVHSYDQRVRNNVLTLHQKIKEVFDNRSDRYKFEFVLRAKAMSLWSQIRMMSHRLYGCWDNNVITLTYTVYIRCMFLYCVMLFYIYVFIFLI